MPRKPLNQFTVSKALGSRVRPIGTTAFGGFGLIRTTARIIGARPSREERTTASMDDDRRIARAFERMRDGYAPGRILWDREFERAFIKQCRGFGLELPEETLKRRLITIRKDPSRFRARGIVLSPTRKREPRPAPPGHGIHAIEYALVRLRYRWGASIDDVLLDQHLGEEFERMARAIEPDLSSSELRLGALYIRKSVNRASRGRRFYEELDLAPFESAMTDLGRFATVVPEDIPEDPGVSKITEGDRYLFVAVYQDLRSSLEPLVSGEALEAMADRFWQPDKARLSLSVFAGTEFAGVPVRDWRIKLIRDRGPIFNWPVLHRVA